MEDDYDYVFKIILLGSSDAGKSELIIRFIDGIFFDGFIPTIGVDFVIK